MAGLIDSKDGLSYGIGLSFEPGLGFRGLINPTAGQSLSLAASFAGSGSLQAQARENLRAAVTLPGVGGLQANGAVV